MSATKCQICKCEDATTAWQPFGPAESPMSFSFLGSHYRGFPVVKVCDTCRLQAIEGAANNRSGPVHFAYKGVQYVFDGGHTPRAIAK